jgi:hypothetical protein
LRGPVRLGGGVDNLFAWIEFYDFVLTQYSLSNTTSSVPVPQFNTDIAQTLAYRIHHSCQHIQFGICIALDFSHFNFSQLAATSFALAIPDVASLGVNGDEGSFLFCSLLCRPLSRNSYPIF